MVCLGEMVLSSIVVSLLKAVEQYNSASTEYLAEPILACARVFDETILRLHTSMVLFLILLYKLKRLWHGRKN